MGTTAWIVALLRSRLDFYAMTDKLLFIYEPAQVLHAAAHAAGRTIIALDYEVELDLKKHGIPFVSIRALARSIEGEREPVELARRLSMSWYQAPEMAFFRHGAVSLGEPHKGPLHYYFGFLLYYLALLDQVLERPGIASVATFEPFTQLPSTVDPTALYKERLPADLLRLLAERRGIPCEIIPAPLLRRAGGALGVWRRAAFEFSLRAILSLLNAVVSIGTRPRPVRILSTDPWARVAPSVAAMPDAEVVLARRTDAANMGAAIWHSRARFHHRLDFADTVARTLARRTALECARVWDTLPQEPVFAAAHTYRGISFWPISRTVLQAIIKEHTEDAVATIESARRLIARYKINCVLLFSSLKGYNNLLAQLAEELNVPSIEMQHALELTEPSHPYSALHSRYLAAYGPLTQKNYERFGVNPTRVVPCGSPRFDMYAKPLPQSVVDGVRKDLRLKTAAYSALALLHSVYSPIEPGEFTAYCANEYLDDLAEVERRMPVRLLLRPHAGDMGEKLYGRKGLLDRFSSETRLVHKENLRALLALSDVVIAGYTTVVLESLIMRKPVIMYLPKHFERDFDAFEQAGAVKMARTVDELVAHLYYLADPRNREEQVAAADRFLARSYLADGKAAERVTALIRRVAKEADTDTIGV